MPDSKDHKKITLGEQMLQDDPAFNVWMSDVNEEDILQLKEQLKAIVANAPSTVGDSASTQVFLVAIGTVNEIVMDEVEVVKIEVTGLPGTIGHA